MRKSWLYTWRKDEGKDTVVGGCTTKGQVVGWTVDSEWSGHISCLIYAYTLAWSGLTCFSRRYLPRRVIVQVCAGPTCLFALSQMFNVQSSSSSLFLDRPTYFLSAVFATLKFEYLIVGIWIASSGFYLELLFQMCRVAPIGTALLRVFNIWVCIIPLP